MSRALTRSPSGHAEHHHHVTLLTARAADMLADLAQADPVNPVSDRLLAAAPSVQNLSLRNQTLLLLHAGRHKLGLSDVDTESGWARRGRAPSGPGMQIVRADIRALATTPAVRTSRPFWVDYRWDFAQTVPLKGARDPQTEPLPAGNSARFATKLFEQQLSRYHYQVDTCEDGQTCEVDHDARVVPVAASVWNTDPANTVRVLIRALAEVMTIAPSPHSDAGDRCAGREGPRSRQPRPRQRDDQGGPRGQHS